MADTMTEQQAASAAGTANPFRAGDRVTFLQITSWSAMCFRREVMVKSALAVPTVGGYGDQTKRYGTFSERGKRKEFYLESERDCSIFLRGWDLPVRVDTDEDQRKQPDGNGFSTKVMRGNACYNLVGDAATLRGLLDTGAVVPVTDEQRGRCLLIGPGSRDETPLYPEIDTGHAVMRQIKERTAASA